MKYNTAKHIVTQKFEDFSNSNLLRTQQAIFIHVCREGLVESLDEYFKNNNQKFINEDLIKNALKTASYYGKENVIKYLLESPTCKLFFQQEDIQLAFITACSYGNIDLTKYLLISPKLEQHANVNLNIIINSKDPYSPGSNNGFFAAIKGEQIELIKVLIFDMNLQYSRKIKDYLRRKPNEEVIQMFTAKKSLDDLHKSLPINEYNHQVKRNKKI